jgi:2'-hydroxyisoflavone reductase
MPAWVPENGENAGFSQVNIAKALSAGLKFTDLSTTIGDTLKWEFERPTDHEWKAGLKPEREKELLELLREK